jgi:hypothetical protein
MKIKKLLLLVVAGFLVATALGKLASASSPIGYWCSREGFLGRETKLLLVVKPELRVRLSFNQRGELHVFGAQWSRSNGYLFSFFSAMPADRLDISVLHSCSLSQALDEELVCSYQPVEGRGDQMRTMSGGHLSAYRLSRCSEFER